MMARLHANTKTRIADFLRANGINPGLVPASSTVVVEFGTITVEELVLDENGNRIIRHDSTLLTRTVVYPLLEPLTKFGP